jgi:hypothetical protein
MTRIRRFAYGIVSQGAVVGAAINVLIEMIHHLSLMYDTGPYSRWPQLVDATLYLKIFKRRC